MDSDPDDLFDHAPCGYIVVLPNRSIARVNTTLANWLGYQPEALVGTMITDLFTVGARIHFETHFAPLLALSGELKGVTVDLVASGGTRLPVFLTANVKTDDDGAPTLLRMIVQDAQDRRTYEKELLAERQRAEEERARVHLLASTLQRSLIPPSLTPPPGLEASAYLHAASPDHVGGDFYDLFPLTTDRWGFFLGDVSGKGAPAAAMTSLTRYTLRAAAVYDEDPIAVLRNLNTVLNHEFHGDDPRFTTVIFGVLSRREEGFDVQLASGGHPSALFIRADGTATYVETEGGQLVGVVPDAHFVSSRIRLEAGDTLVLYTDGLTEARIGTGTERFDDAGALLAFARSRAANGAVAIVDDMRRLLSSFGTGLEDDAAVLALGVPVQP